MKKIDFIYNEKEDTLYLSDKSKAVKYSIGIEDIFVIDFDENNRVIGLEILDASEAIYNISKNILKHITKANIGVNYKKDTIVIGFAMKSSVADEPIRSSVPLPILAKSG